MSHVFKFIVEVTLDRDQGKFISRDELAEELSQAIEYADPGSVDVDESTYSVSDWSVSEAPSK